MKVGLAFNVLTKTVALKRYGLNCAFKKCDQTELLKSTYNFDPKNLN